MSYVILALTSIIGILVTLLRLKGSALHKVQVELLESRLNSLNKQYEQKVDAAKAKYAKAYEEYYDSLTGKDDEKR